MSERKERLTVTLDPQVVAAGNAAVATGKATSLSAWVNQALSDRLERERRLEALGQAIAAYEAEAGVITEAEMEAGRAADRKAASRVRRQVADALRRRRRP